MRTALADGALQENTLPGEALEIESTPWWRKLFHVGRTAGSRVGHSGCGGAWYCGSFFTYSLKPGAAPLAVVLTATRGGSVQAAKAAGPMDLDMDARELAPSGTFRVQVVNGDGAEVWAGSSDAKNGRVHVLVQKRFSPGQYYVRLADPAGQRREFAPTPGKLNAKTLDVLTSLP